MKPRLQELDEEEKLLTKPWHANQLKRLQKERFELLAKLNKLAPSACHSAEFAQERYQRAVEYQSLLSKLEQKWACGGPSENPTSFGVSPAALRPVLTPPAATTPQFCTNPACASPAIAQPPALAYDSIQSVLSCPECGKTVTFIDATANLTAYGDEVEIVSFAYKRVGHFRDQLLYAQGKESTKIEEAVIQQICGCLRRDLGFTAKEQIQPDDVSTAMKKLGLRKYYKNRIQVHTRITGIPPFRLTAAQEKGFLHMFKLMQPAYGAAIAKERPLPYKLVANRFCEYFGLTEFQKLFPLPKSLAKQRAFDFVFGQIARELRWDVKRFRLATP